jgi:replicative DNA helicase
MTELDFGLGGFRPAAERLAQEGELRRQRAARVMPWNIAFLDDIALGIYPTDLTVFCAATGAGKTTVAALISQLAAAQGRRVHFFALEAHASEIEQRMLFRTIRDVARERGLPCRLSYAEWMHGRSIPAGVEEDARARLVGQLSGLRTFYREQRFTAQDITRLFAAIQHETDLIVLDHLHYVDSDDPNENRAIRDATRAVRDIALAIEKPVVVVAHLRKKDNHRPRLIPDLDDVHGSSEIVKVATKVIALAPARNAVASAPGVANTYMQVTKDRLAGATGLAALLAYDLQTLRYRDRYVLGRVTPAGDAWEALQAEQLPRWAARAVGYQTRHHGPLGAPGSVS